jgi:putative DNA methylase
VAPAYLVGAAAVGRVPECDVCFAYPRANRPELCIGCIVFAHKGTSAWETLLASIVDAGFVVTASWPIDTERASRMRANDSAALQTSVHLVVRPRENADGSVRTNEIGDWRDVLRELPPRIKS